MRDQVFVVVGPAACFAHFSVFLSGRRVGAQSKDWPMSTFDLVVMGAGSCPQVLDKNVCGVATAAEAGEDLQMHSERRKAWR